MINEYKKLRLTLLEYKPRGLMAENKNVYKTIRLEIYIVYYDKILYMCECGRVVLSRMSVLTLNANVLASNIGISKKTRLFSCPIHCTSYCVLSHCIFHVSLFRY